MIKQEKARSVYIMVHYDQGPYFGSLLEVKLDGKKQQSSSPIYLKPVALFKAKELSIPVLWNFCTSGGGSSTNLYLLPDSGPDEVWNTELPSLKGYIFDAKARKLVSSIKPPKAPKWFGPAVSAYGKIYFLVDPYCSPEVLEPSFERYDPNTDSWEGLKPFPYTEDWGKTEVVGCAICDGFILVNIGGRSGCALWAYDVRGNEWHRVIVKDRECYYFKGQAVVANETIYGLMSSSSSVSVMAFSIRREQAGEGFAVTCSVDSLFKSPDMEDQFPLPADWTSQLLVHLRNLEFCLVLTAGRYHDPYQLLLITTFQLVGKSEIKITYSRQYMVPFDCGLRKFRVNFGFSPDCDDMEQREEEIASDCDDIEQQEEAEGVIEFILDCEYIVPAKEEKIATLMDQPKQKEETMVNVSSICLTGDRDCYDCDDMEQREEEIASDCDDIEQQEEAEGVIEFILDCEYIVPAKEEKIATLMDQPKQKEETMVNVSSICLTGDFDDMEPGSNQPAEKEENFGPMTTFARITQNCNSCEKTVYLVDQLVVNDKVYHKACFRCDYCKGTPKESLSI